MTLGKPVNEIVQESTNSLLGKHNSWKRVELNLVAEILNGFAFESSSFSKTKGFPLIRIRDVGKNKTECLYDGKFEPLYVVRKGDLLVGMDGDFNSAVWKGDEGLLNQRVCKISVHQQFYDSKFLELVLPAYLKEINNHTSSVTVKHLSSKSIAEIPLPLPPLTEQHYIVGKVEELFSFLDAGVASLRTVQVQLKRYRKAVLNNAIMGKLVSQKSSEASVSKLIEATRKEKELLIKDKKIRKEKPSAPVSAREALFTLPRGWDWIRLIDLIALKNNAMKRGPFGGSLKKEIFVEQGYLVYEQRHAIHNDFEYEKYFVTNEKYKEMMDFKVEPGDLIVSCSGVTLGRISEVPKNAKAGIINQALLKTNLK